MFARIDIFKITETNNIKNKIGIAVKKLKLLKIKNKYNKRNDNDRIITAFLNTEIIAKE